MKSKTREYVKLNRPEQAGTLVGVRLQPDQLELLDAWIALQSKPYTRPEAIRHLMDIAVRFEALATAPDGVEAIAIRALRKILDADPERAVIFHTGENGRIDAKLFHGFELSKKVHDLELAELHKLEDQVMWGPLRKLFGITPKSE